MPFDLSCEWHTLSVKNTDPTHTCLELSSTALPYKESGIRALTCTQCVLALRLIFEALSRKQIDEVASSHAGKLIILGGVNSCCFGLLTLINLKPRNICIWKLQLLMAHSDNFKMLPLAVKLVVYATNTLRNMYIIPFK